MFKAAATPILFLVIFLTATFSFAEERFVLSFNVDYLENLYKGQIAIAEKEKEIIRLVESLSNDIDAKKPYATNAVMIEKIGNESVLLGEMVLKNVRDAIPIRKGLDELVGEKEIKKNRPFGYFETLDMTKEIYDILEDAAAVKISNSEIKKRYKKQTDAFDKRLDTVITSHTALWIKDINSGVEYDKISQDYKQLIIEILDFNAKIYNGVIVPLNDQQIAKVKAVRTVKINKMLADRDERIAKNNKKSEK